MEGKNKLLQSRLINVERKMWTEHHHLPHIIVVGKHHQGMLISVSQNIIEFLHSLKVSPHKILIVYKEKDSSFIEKPGKHHFNQVMKMITTTETYGHIPSNITHQWAQHNITPMAVKL